MTRDHAAMTPGQAFQLLGLPSGADAAAVDRAFRAAVKTAHPDVGGDAERLRRIIEAHRILKALSRATLSFSPAPAGAPQAGPAPPRAVALEISVREAIFGGSRRLGLEAGRAVEVRLPAGLRAGDVVRLAHADGEGAHVVLQVSIAAEPGLRARGDDIWMELSARPGQTGPGARLRVDTPRGPRAVSVADIPAEGAALRLKGEGLPARGPHPAGDLVLKLIPAALAEEPTSRRLLRRFAARWAA